MRMSGCPATLPECSATGSPLDPLVRQACYLAEQVQQDQRDTGNDETDDSDPRDHTRHAVRGVRREAEEANPHALHSNELLTQHHQQQTKDSEERSQLPHLHLGLPALSNVGRVTCSASARGCDPSLPHEARCLVDLLVRLTLVQRVDGELSARIPDGDDLDQVGAAPVDNPIWVDEELPDVAALQFTDDPSAVGEGCERFDLVEDCLLYT